MLAFMPLPSPLPDPHMSNLMVQSGRTSLPLLPSTSMSSMQQSPTTSFAPRPKLTLNTSNIAPIFGKASTSLRLETLSAASPTSRNTFQNGQARRTKRPEKPILTPIATNVASPSIISPSPSEISLPDFTDDAASFSTSPLRSETTVSTPNSSPCSAPYKLPFNATSILANGPIPRNTKRKLSFAQSRPMFPAPKKVLFRAPLTEEIETTKYTLRHSDIESLISIPEPAAESEDVAERGGDDALKSGSLETLSSPTSGFKRGPTDIESHSEAATPVAGRSKRHRWVWTLGPIQPAQLGPCEEPSFVENLAENLVHSSPV